MLNGMLTVPVMLQCNGSWGVPQYMKASLERPLGTYSPKYLDLRLWTVHVDGSMDLDDALFRSGTKIQWICRQR